MLAGFMVVTRLRQGRDPVRQLIPLLDRQALDSALTAPSRGQYLALDTLCIACSTQGSSAMVGTTFVLAVVTFRNPSSMVGWIIVDLIAGWTASHAMGDGDRGVIGDVVVGLIGRRLAG